ncbi:MAG: PEP/pyruvate-binding domain-containing protein [Nanoarchaeota archaeon]
MEFIRSFKEIGKEDVAIAGGKGASLGEMTKAGIPVPEGYVVLSNAFEQFIKKTDLNVEIDAILDTVKHEEVHTVEEASEKIQSLIVNSEMPKNTKKEILNSFDKLEADFVAVRSSATSEDSATAAWAGQLDSYLNTTKKELLENVKRCWASLFTPRAIFYRFEKKLHGTAISVAVVVQKMVNSEESGIAFSVHPVTQDYNQLIIEAGFGLGEAIVQGSITPDSYVIDKQDWHIIDINVNEQNKGLFIAKNGGNEWRDLGEKGKEQVLNEKEIIELSKLIVKIEKHYGFPCDIEWAKEKGKFYIVQSRPITTLTDQPKTHISRKRTLVNIFSREKSLVYFEMWDESDRKGMEIIGEEIKNNLFIVPPLGQKGSVWYEQEELTLLKDKVITKLSEHKNNESWKVIKRLAEKSWKFIEPYAKDEKRINNVIELKTYYDNLVDFWVCLNSILYEVLDSPKLDKEIKRYLTEFRDKTEKYTEKMSAVLSEYIEQQDKLKRISNFVTIEEAIDVLNNKIKKIDLEKLKERVDGCFMLNQIVHPYERIEEIIMEHELSFEKIKSNAEEIRGDSAFGGIVRGIAKIVDGFKDLEKITSEDILVTQMTNPKYLSAIKIALGVVTDQGGTLCHAAITARELKKPCVIATKIATKVLKDGDLIELDANKGVVRIIEKTKERRIS